MLGNGAGCWDNDQMIDVKTWLRWGKRKKEERTGSTRKGGEEGSLLAQKQQPLTSFD